MPSSVPKIQMRVTMIDSPSLRAAPQHLLGQRQMRRPSPGRALRAFSTLLTGGAEVAPLAVVAAEGDPGLANGRLRRDRGAVVHAGAPGRRDTRRDARRFPCKRPRGSPTLRHHTGTGCPIGSWLNRESTTCHRTRSLLTAIGGLSVQAIPNPVPLAIITPILTSRLADRRARVNTLSPCTCSRHRQTPVPRSTLRPGRAVQLSSRSWCSPFLST